MVSWLRRRDPWDTATLILLVVVAVIMFLTFRDYGVSWDEEFSRTQGTDFLRWYTSGFRDYSIMRTQLDEYLYGHFFNTISILVSDHLPFGPYEGGHLVIAMTGLLGIFFAYRLGRLLAGPMAGFLSALILTLTPTYFGHSFINPKDLPFAVFFLVAVYYLVRLYDELPAPRARAVVVTGIAIGLALGIRVGGVILFGYLVVLVGLWYLVRYTRQRSLRTAIVATDVRDTLVAMILIVALAWAVMLVWWPFAQLDPIANPLAGIQKSASYSSAKWTNLYQGTYTPADSLPWHYLPVLFLVMLPEYYVVGMVAGIAGLVMLMIHNRHGDGKVKTDAVAKLLFCVFAALFPLVVALVVRPVVYDGTRLFLFVIPPLAVLSGVAIWWLLSRALPPISRMAAALLLVVIAAATIIDMVRLYPYEYAFFNRSSGGIRGAYGRFETEYWGVSYKEGVDWLSKNYRPDAPPASIRVGNTSNPFLTGYYFSADRPSTRRFVQVGLDQNPNVILSITRWNQHLNYPGRVLHVVERMGTPLLYVIETNPAIEAPSS
ncbi:MAG TPA: glycosyltransferase family 39 protein [Gemmatimonadaceae bacterium]|nr:glycosyltransferase family 39 protein [Gemmatimonadaceae bacterium]